jgi:hypothetical protein
LDAELKQYLIEMEERLVSSLEAYRNEVASLKAYVNERCEEVETKLLTGFHAWASPTEARHRTISAALRAIDLEMEAIDDPVKKLEGRPPQ